MTIHTSNRGFAALDGAKRREIASKGGRAAHEKGTAHEFTTEEASAAGKIGGKIISQNRGYMAAIGRKGGKARKSQKEGNMKDYAKIIQLKQENTKLTQEEIAKQVDASQSTISRALRGVSHAHAGTAKNSSVIAAVLKIMHENPTLSQKEVADLIGTSQGSVSRVVTLLKLVRTDKGYKRINMETKQVEDLV